MKKLLFLLLIYRIGISCGNGGNIMKLGTVFTRELQNNGIYISSVRKLSDDVDIYENKKDILYCVVVTPIENIIRYTKNTDYTDENGNVANGYYVYGNCIIYKGKTIEEIRGKITKNFQGLNFSNYILDYWEDFELMCGSNLGNLERGITG